MSRALVAVRAALLALTLTLAAATGCATVDDGEALESLTARVAALEAAATSTTARTTITLLATATTTVAMDWVAVYAAAQDVADAVDHTLDLMEPDSTPPHIADVLLPYAADRLLEAAVVTDRQVSDLEHVCPNSADAFGDAAASLKAAVDHLDEDYRARVRAVLTSWRDDHDDALDAVARCVQHDRPTGNRS